MSFSKGSWAQRVGTLGDTAEAAFDNLYPAHHKSGLNRPPMKVGDIDPTLRNIPDRMLYGAFVEVLGFGRDQTAKFKLEKLIAQLRWSAFKPVWYFLWDSTNERHWIADIEVWWFAMIREGQYGAFDDGNEYIGLHVSKFPAEAAQVAAP